MTGTISTAHAPSAQGLPDPEYWHRVGRTLERGLFDFVFFADLLTGTTLRENLDLGEG